MTEENISHVEVVQEETVESKKESTFRKNLLDFGGWKRDLKKIIIIVSILVIAFFMYKAGLKIFEKPMGVRFHAPIERVKFQEAKHENPGFAFKYSEKYSYDGDQQKKYGADYLGGFHLINDDRTGCDVRRNEVGINFSKSDQEINEAVSKDLAAQVKGFAEFSGKRIKLGKSDAYVSNFLLTDPLGNTLHIQQTLVSKDGQNYILVCGSSQAQYEYFQQDFQDFLDSFRWTT